MKRICVVLLSLLLALSLGSCAAKEEGGGVPNPVTDSTAGEILETLGIDFRLPEGVADAAYSVIGADGETPVAQVKFTLDGNEISYRVQPAEALSDNTGMYFEWENTLEDAAIGGLPAIVSWNEGAEGVCCWYDAAPGLLYSVSVTEGASEEYLTGLAQTLRALLSGAANGNSGPDFTASGLGEELAPWIAAIDSCVAETFGADADFTQGYLRLYDTEEAALAGENCAALVPEQELSGTDGTYEGRYVDPGYASLYPISNYTAAADAEAYLKQYLSDAAYETMVGEALGWDLYEFEGKLYLVRGGRGYGAESYDWSTAAYRGRQNGLAIVTVGKRMFDEPSGTDAFFFGSDADGVYKVIKKETVAGVDGSAAQG